MRHILNLSLDCLHTGAFWDRSTPTCALHMLPNTLSTISRAILRKPRTSMCNGASPAIRDLPILLFLQGLHTIDECSGAPFYWWFRECNVCGGEALFPLFRQHRWMVTEIWRFRMTSAMKTARPLWKQRLSWHQRRRRRWRGLATQPQIYTNWVKSVVGGGYFYIAYLCIIVQHGYLPKCA